MGAVNDKERDMETGEGKLKIYCETSFWSCLVGGPTSDEKVARWQSLTRNGSGNLSDYQMTGAIARFNGSPFARRGERGPCRGGRGWKGAGHGRSRTGGRSRRAADRSRASGAAPGRAAAASPPTSRPTRRTPHSSTRSSGDARLVEIAPSDGSKLRQVTGRNRAK